jgi:hypothetical protein
MKKDYLWFTILGLLLFSYVLDQIAGPVTFSAKNPYAFLAAPTLSTYPLSAVSIAAKALGLMLVFVTAFSYLHRAHILKAITFFILGSLVQLYAIQQLATRGQVTPIQWTLGIAYAGALLLIPAALQLIQGLLQGAHQAIVKEIAPIKHDLKKTTTTNNMIDSNSHRKE